MLAGGMLHPRPAVAGTIPHDVLYIQSNIDAAGQNSVIGYARAADGTLTPLAGSPYPTGGTGFYDPSYKLGPFDTDQNLVADPNTGVLFAPNSGSNTIAALKFAADGSLIAVPGSPFRAGGSNPLALGVNRHNLIVVNGDENPSRPTPNAHPSFSVSHILGSGQLIPIAGTSVVLADGSAPGQALTTNTDGLVFTQEFLGGTLRSFIESPLGQLYELDSTPPPLEPGETSQPLPLGLWAYPTKPLLYVGLVNVNRVGVYRWLDDGKLIFLRSVLDSGAAPCWLRVNAAGTRLYVVNTGTGTIAVYDLTDPELPVQIQDAVVATGPGALFQFSLSPDQRFLYVLEQESSGAAVGKSNQIHVLAVHPVTGKLTENVAALTKLPVPPLTRSVGMLVF
jgi:6-phosphogluconolactonase (cycloisomerase 2 family)